MRRFIMLSIVTFACVAGQRVEALELFGWSRNRPAMETYHQLPTSATEAWYDASASHAGEVMFDEYGAEGYDACCDECGDCCCKPRLRCCYRKMMARARRCCRRVIRCCQPAPTCCEPEPVCCEPVDCCPKRCRLFSRLRFRPDCCPYCADEASETAIESWSEGQAVEVSKPSSDAAVEWLQPSGGEAPMPLMDISI